MTPELLLKTAIIPALSLLNPKPDTPGAHGAKGNRWAWRLHVVSVN